MQRSRRTNPYPYTWEVPASALLALLLLLLLGLQAGRSVANLVTGNGWVFVARDDLFTSLGGVLGGDAAAGLQEVTHPAPAGLMWTCVAVLEVLVLVGSVWAAAWALGRWGPGRLRGVASVAEAERLLGRARLRRHAKVIRPDLYGPRAKGQTR
ncbi:hypothetical protein [Phycicoccus flavus]|uniref:hypothetical protein n=1 Tax=Phycicoccus flavus TaxID=2502783 RepID=UPI000FEB949D|nr:hypothetical protein [Phycicoccus flavus]NHA70157.1 hypothetical protein [Phycicoccus flavus]